MMKHTPGPWSWWPQSAGGVVTQDSSAAHICVPSERPDREANARLIAASPDLLAALKAWRELRDSDGADGRDSVEWIATVESQMRSAIAKAEGKS